MGKLVAAAVLAAALLCGGCSGAGYGNVGPTNTASGNVDVELTRLEGTGDMRFSSASGDVSVRLPSSLDARVDMSTASGSIETDFPIEVRKDRYSSGYTARGQLGSGSRLLKISSASGDVKLKSL